MKKTISLILALIMAAICLAGCSQIKSNDTTKNGAIIDVYMGTKVMNLDPAVAYTDENAVKIINLLFEGLMKIDARGNLSKALAKSYKIYKDDKTEETVMQITINTTYWSDSSLVQANDIVYAWKRILDPDFQTEAASLLYYIKDARKAKLGEVGIDDIGLYSLSKNKLEIRFEEGADTNEFLYNLASPALVPLRENKISLYPATWSRSSTDLSSNGPFRAKKFSNKEGEVLVLERNKYYYRSPILNKNRNVDALDKYVTPYQIYFHFSDPLDLETVYSQTAETDIATMYSEKQILYASNITANVAGQFPKTKTTDLASTYSYYFNTSVAPFDNASVRYALSIAIDRSAIAEDVGGGVKAATGLVPYMVFNTSKGNSFRKVGKDILSKSSEIEKAAEILNEAGVNPSKYGDIYLYYLADSTNDSYYSAQMGYKSKEKIAAEYVEQAWEALGFSVVLKGVSSAEYEEVYKSKDYDVIGLDYQAVSPYAFYMLAPFASGFSGGAEFVKGTGITSRTEFTVIGGKMIFREVTFGEDNHYKSTVHTSGYHSEEYDALIEEAYSKTNQKERAAILHTAEQLLIDDAPVIPVLFNADSYVISNQLSGVDINYFGSKLFTHTSVKNYMKSYSYLSHNNLLPKEDEETEE